MSDDSQHGPDQNPYRPGGDSEGALESASHVLGVPESSNGAPSSGERRILQGRQERDLEIWAKERGCWRGSLTYRDLDQVAVFDAHPANFLKDGQGIILPIDGVVVECDDALAAQVEDLLSAVAAD